MKIILENSDVNSAIRCFLLEKNIITDDDSLDVDITKTRTGDGGVTAEISIIKMKEAIANTVVTSYEEVEPYVDGQEESGDLPDDEENGVSLFDNEGTD